MTEMHNETLFDFVSRTAFERGKTLTDFQKDTGISRLNIYNSRTRRPQAKTYRALSKWLGIPVTELTKYKVNDAKK